MKRNKSLWVVIRRHGTQNMLQNAWLSFKESCKGVIRGSRPPSIDTCIYLHTRAHTHTNTYTNTHTHTQGQWERDKAKKTLLYHSIIKQCYNKKCSSNKAWNTSSRLCSEHEDTIVDWFIVHKSACSMYFIIVIIFSIRFKKIHFMYAKNLTETKRTNHQIQI